MCNRSGFMSARVVEVFDADVEEGADIERDEHTCKDKYITHIPTSLYFYYPFIAEETIERALQKNDAMLKCY